MHAVRLCTAFHLISSFIPQQLELLLAYVALLPLCRYWHDHTRIDTRPNRKIRIRVGPGKYKEHWRHIRFDTCEEMWLKFKASAEHSKYAQANPTLPISKDIFYESRCACIKEAEFEECACPEHTLLCAALP